MRYINLCLFIILIIGLKTAWSSGINFNDTDSPAPTSQVGNFGIGTTTPQARLAIVGGNVGLGTWTAANARLETDGFRLMNNGAAAGSVLVSSSTGIGTWMAPGTLPSSGGGSSGWSTGSGTVYATTGSDNVGIGTSTPQGGLVVTNGYVGIGTWVPSNLLSIVKGNVGIGTNVNPHALLEVVGDGSKELLRLNDSGQNDTTAFVIDSSGKVGIGTTSVLSTVNTFQVYGSANTPVATIQNSSNGRAMEIGGATQNHESVVFLNTNNTAFAKMDLGFRFNAGVGQAAVSWGGMRVYNRSSTLEFGFLTSLAMEVMRMRVDGNIGIGTVDPKSKLVVATGGVAIGSYMTSNFVQSAAPVGGLIVENNVGFGTTTPQNKLSVMGNVGIGTWSAAAALDVNNSIIFHSEYPNTCSAGGSITIDFNNGNKQNLTLTSGACSVTLTGPSGVANLLLKVVQPAGGASTISWVTTIKWPSGTTPTLTSAGSSQDILTFYYDGSTFYGSASLDLR